ncbi:hypothetical protein WMW72_00960 [Paenibacillus filicis]|uniref:Uncharacterized protein n=1 Tax=Paenibacillus filicis TaxID=669464 RepID=A0ABU9DCA2_9BACL
MSVYWIELLMWLSLFVTLMLTFSILLMDFVVSDSSSYDLEVLWKGQYTRQELHLEPDDD